MNFNERCEEIETKLGEFAVRMANLAPGIAMTPWVLEQANDLSYLLKSARVMREALEAIHAHSGKTRLADCCVEKSCTAHCVDGELVSNCAYQSGVFDGYATTAQIAEEALAKLNTPAGNANQ